MSHSTTQTSAGKNKEGIPESVLKTILTLFSLKNPIPPPLPSPLHNLEYSAVIPFD